MAQALCERQHFSNRARFLQLKETFAEFWKNGILPIMNENDLVSNVELKFSDNDELATLTAIGFDAEALLLCTSVGGFLNADKQIIPVVEKVDSRILGFVQTGKSSLGLGGMLSKLTFTRLAVSLGIRVVICGLSGSASFSEALAGKTGTSFMARPSNLRARQKWAGERFYYFGQHLCRQGCGKSLTTTQESAERGYPTGSGKICGRGGGAAKRRRRADRRGGEGEAGRRGDCRTGDEQEYGGCACR